MGFSLTGNGSSAAFTAGRREVDRLNSFVCVRGSGPVNDAEEEEGMRVGEVALDPALLPALLLPLDTAGEALADRMRLSVRKEKGLDSVGRPLNRDFFTLLAASFAAAFFSPFAGVDCADLFPLFAVLRLSSCGCVRLFVDRTGRSNSARSPAAYRTLSRRLAFERAKERKALFSKEMRNNAWSSLERRVEDEEV